MLLKMEIPGSTVLKDPLRVYAQCGHTGVGGTGGLWVWESADLWVFGSVSLWVGGSAGRWAWVTVGL